MVDRGEPMQHIAEARQEDFSWSLTENGVQISDCE